MRPNVCLQRPANSKRSAAVGRSAGRHGSAAWHRACAADYANFSRLARTGALDLTQRARRYGPTGSSSHAGGEPQEAVRRLTDQAHRCLPPTVPGEYRDWFAARGLVQARSTAYLRLRVPDTSAHPARAATDSTQIPRRPDSRFAAKPLSMTTKRTGARSSTRSRGASAHACKDAERPASPARNQQAQRRWLSVRCKRWFGVATLNHPL